MDTPTVTVAAFAPSPLVTGTVESGDLDPEIHFHAGGQGVWVAPCEGRGHDECEAWTHEFIERWCPGAAELTQLDVRVGPPGPRLLQAAREARADLVALAWS